MHKFIVEKKLEEILSKIERKNKSLYEQLKNKMNEIINNSDIEHYKNLRHDLKDFKRVQVGHFVLIFKYDKRHDMVIFEDFDHHDNIYKK